MSVDATKRFVDILKQVVPERVEELEHILQEHNFNFQVSETTGLPFLEGGAFSSIRTSDQTSFLILLITKLFWVGITKCSGELMLAHLNEKTIGAVDALDSVCYHQIKSVNTWSQVLFKDAIESDKILNNILFEAQCEPTNMTDRAIRDTFYIAYSFMLFHEMAHTVLNKDTGPENELECDCWAMEFLLDKSIYCPLSEQEKNRGKTGLDVFYKRWASFLVAMFVIFVQDHISKEKNKSVSYTHPCIYDRIAPLVYKLECYIGDDYSDIMNKAYEALVKYPELKNVSHDQPLSEDVQLKILQILSTANHNIFWPTLATALSIIFQIKGVQNQIKPVVGLKAFCLVNLELLKG